MSKRTATLYLESLPKTAKSHFASPSTCARASQARRRNGNSRTRAPSRRRLLRSLREGGPPRKNFRWHCSLSFY